MNAPLGTVREPAPGYIEKQITLIGQRVRDERHRLGLTQGQLATQACLAVHEAHQIEVGTLVPNAVTLNLWALLGMNVTYVVTGETP